MRNPIDFIERELSKRPDRRPTKKGHNIWICCPNKEHSGGNEALPSMAINTTNENYDIGMAHCFGCGITLKWDALADILGVRKMKNALVEARPVVTSNARARLLGKTLDVRKVGPPEMSIAWSKTTAWRGISGALLHDLGAKMDFNPKQNETRIALPVVMDNTTEWIYGVIHRSSKSQLAYVNTDGPWAKSALFPYTFVKTMLRDMEYRIVLVSEGPRDALNSIQHGLPALAVLGAGSATSKQKLAMLLELDPDLVVIAMDNDAAGEKASAKLVGALKKLVPIVKLKLPDGSDVGEMSRKGIHRVHVRALQRLKMSKEDAEQYVKSVASGYGQ